MSWIYLLLAVGAFAVARLTSSMLLMVACLLVALGLLLASALALYAKRSGTRRNDVPMPPDMPPPDTPSPDVTPR